MKSQEQGRIIEEKYERRQVIKIQSISDGERWLDEFLRKYSKNYVASVYLTPL